MSRPHTLAAVSLLAVVATLSVHPVLSQSPVVPAVVIPAKSVWLLEIDPDDKAALVLVDPPNATFRFFPPSTLFVESAAVKGGVIRVLQVSPGESPTNPKVRWYSWTVGPPVPPAPVILPTAKLSVDPPTVKAIGDEVRQTWATTGADKVTLDGKEVEPNGSDTFQIEQPLTLFTLVASTADHTVYAQAVVSVGEKPPPVPPGPIFETGLRVLITYDNPTKHQLPRSQLAAIDSPTLRTYLDSVVAKSSSGQPEKRFWDAGVTPGDDQPNMKKLMAVQKATATTPWIVISPAKGSTGFSGPLPLDEQAIVDLVKRYQ